MPPFLAKFGLHIAIFLIVLVGFGVLGFVIYEQYEAQLASQQKIAALATANAVQQETINSIKADVANYNQAIQSINAGLLAIQNNQTAMYKSLTQFQNNQALLVAANKDPSAVEKQASDSLNAIWSNLRDISDPAKLKAEINAMPTTKPAPVSTSTQAPPSLLDKINPLKLFGGL